MTADRTASEQARQAHLEAVLELLHQTFHDLAATMVIHVRGPVLASRTPTPLDAEYLLSLCNALSGLSDPSSSRLAAGSLQELIIRSPLGYFVALPLGGSGYLAARTLPSARLGLILMRLRQAARYLRQVM